jgi:hypothetical protein
MACKGTRQETLKLKAIKYFLVGKNLYWKDPLGLLMICLDPHKVERIMSDFHDSSCGGNNFWKMTSHNILSDGYFWPTLFTDVSTKVSLC